VPAHVTVLYPFVAPQAIDAGVLAQLSEAVTAVPAFGAEWRATGWFGTDVLWLAPEPERTFRELTKRVWSAFPECPPYEGEHDDVVPHLTIARGVPIDDLRAAEREVLAKLPIRMDVGSVHVMVGTDAPNSWHAIAEQSLG